MSAPKLTAAQLLALVWFSGPFGVRNVKSPPNPRTVRRLVTIGLLSCLPEKIGWERSTAVIRLTPAGRAALEDGAK